jgi:hypothetical protein
LGELKRGKETRRGGDKGRGGELRELRETEKICNSIEGVKTFTESAYIF